MASTERSAYRAGAIKEHKIVDVALPHNSRQCRIQHPPWKRNEQVNKKTKQNRVQNATLFHTTKSQNK